MYNLFVWRLKSLVSSIVNLDYVLRTTNFLLCPWSLWMVNILQGIRFCNKKRFCKQSRANKSCFMCHRHVAFLQYFVLILRQNPITKHRKCSVIKCLHLDLRLNVLLLNVVLKCRVLYNKSKCNDIIIMFAIFEVWWISFMNKIL